jgi:hypothetical protein
VARAVTCIECGAELTEERAQLGYRYCTRESCQARHHRGVAVTAVGVNKSAEVFVVAEPDEIRRRGEGGEFAKKDSALGLNYRSGVTAPAKPAGTAQAGAAEVPSQRRQPSCGPWTAQQEKIVRLYHDMGLSPRQITERARQNVPRLAITERLAIQILSAGSRR